MPPATMLLYAHLTCLAHPCPANPYTQSIVNGFQHEQPDYWLNFGNPWEIERLIVQYPIKFYGHVSVGGCCVTRARGQSGS